jgi:hypothetical protein
MKRKGIAAASVNQKGIPAKVTAYFGTTHGTTRFRLRLYFALLPLQLPHVLRPGSGSTTAQLRRSYAVDTEEQRGLGKMKPG